MQVAVRYSLLVVLLFASACASIPQEGLNAYTSAFDKAREAGEVIVLDFAAATAEQERREDARAAAKKPPPPKTPKLPFPPTYTPPKGIDGSPSATQARLLAWEAIGAYNATLAALNAGESVEKVKSGSGRLVEVMFKLAAAGGSAVPGGAAVAAAVKEIAGRLEQARLAEEFKKAIKDGAPTVRKMLGVFHKDIDDHYELRATLALADYRRVKRRGLTGSERLAEEARIKGAMDEFRKSLDTFRQLLDETDRSLAALERAVDKPIDFSAQASRLLDTALQLKQHWAAYKSARSEAG